MDKNRCCCCACIHFERREKNGKTCYGFCKAINFSILCNVCRDGAVKCEQFEYKCYSCAFYCLGCPIDRETCKAYYPLKRNDNTKVDYYNGRSCLNHIENFFAFHDFLSHYETFYIGNIIKCLWRYKKKNGVKELEKAKQYLDFLIKEQERCNNE